MKHLLKPIIAAAFAATLNFAHAGVIEDLLAIPAIQSLLGRQPELAALANRCIDANYRQRNQATCKQAEEAVRLAKIPPEVRAVLARPAAAASLRELCLGVQATPLAATYLCSELGKAEVGFTALSEERRRAAETATRAKSNEEAQLGR